MSPPKILAVDDEPDFELLRQRFRRQVREGELAVRFAQHGEEALAMLAQEPDIEPLLLDISMPMTDGLILLSVLREQKAPVRAIIVSAHGGIADIRTATVPTAPSRPPELVEGAHPLRPPELVEGAAARLLGSHPALSAKDGASGTRRIVLGGGAL